MTVIQVDFRKEPKKPTTQEIKQKLTYTLDKDIASLEEFEDYNKFLCALALLITDVNIACAYDTGKLPSPSVYCEGLKKLMLKRYEEEGF